MTPVADGVLLEWDAVESGGAVVIYIIERSESPDGPWQEVARTTETRYLYSDGSGLTWYFRITATVRGVAGGSEVVVGTPELVARQAEVDQANAAAARAGLEAAKALALMGTEYDPEVTYAASMVAYKDGRMYRATKAVPVSKPPPDAEFWENVGTVTEAQSANSAAVQQLRTDVDTQGNTFAAAITQVTNKIGGRANLLKNGGFELGGWTSGEYADFAVSDGQWGRTFIHTKTSTINGGGHSTMTPVFQIAPNTVYTLCGDTLLFAAGGRVRFDIQIFNASGSELQNSSSPAFPASHDFQDGDARRQARAFQFTTPAGAVTARVRFVWESVTGCTALGLRQVKLEKGALPATAYSAEGASIDTASATIAVKVAQDAQITIATDVNGRWIGSRTENDGLRGGTTFIMDYFRLLAADGASASIEITGSYLRVFNANYQKIIGVGFGVGGALMEWFGPNIGAANCTTANCIECKTTAGVAIIRGSNAQGSMEIINTLVTIRDNNNVKRVEFGLLVD